MNEHTSDLELVREAELRKLVKLSHSTIWRLCRTDHFPKPIRLTNRTVAWRLVDIEGWLNDRASQSLVRGGSRG
jgi:predicted DNA-binding transcriptional regulator AlpA